MTTRRIGFVFLGLAAVAAVAFGLWAFEAERASASPGDIDVAVTSIDSGTTWAPGTLVSYTVTVNSDAATTVGGDGISLNIALTGAAQEGSFSSPGGVTCTPNVTHDLLDCQVTDFLGAGSKSVSFTARLGGVGTALVGAALDPATTGNFGEVDEGAATETPEDGGNDPDLGCDGVGELTLPNIGPAGPTPPAEPDNFDCVSLTVANGDLTITKTATPASGTTVGQGATIYYTLTVTNASATVSVKDVPIRDTLGTGLTLLAVGGVQPGPGVTCGDMTGPEINCTTDVMAPAATRTVLVNATVTPSTGTVLNGAEVDVANIIGEVNDDQDDRDTGHDCAAVGEGSDVDPDTEEDNFDCTVHAVGEQLDLTLTKTANPSDGTGVATGATITYTVKVDATGQAASNVLIRDILGTGLTFVSIAPASGTAGTGVTCGDTTSPYDCTAASIPAGESRSVTVVATVSATTGSVLNGAYVDPNNTIPETNDDADDQTLECAAVGEGSDLGGSTEPDNFDCTSHTVGALDLTVTKTASPTDGSTVASGASITYTVTVSASGAAASNVAIRDTIGTGLTLVSVTPGSGVTCSDITPPEINCVAATIAASSSVSVTVATTVSATSGTVLNGARVDPANAIAEVNDDADDPGLDCSAVGEGSDAGEATESDNFDCTSHTVSGTTTTTRTLNLSPAGWHNFVWTGATGTEPATALACISGKFSIAYEWVDSLGAWEHYVPGCALADLCTIDPLTKYDPLLVLITADNVTCQMTVAP